MPTGYTDKIKKGITFKTFALNCARAFGACLELRDEGGGGEVIPEVFHPSDYHLKGQDEAIRELQMLNAMTTEECELAAHQNWLIDENRRFCRLQEQSQLRQSYEAMLKQVNAWVPPTPDHLNLQEFMRSQIEESLRFDCYESESDQTTSIRLSGQDWKELRRQELTKDLQYHEREYSQEVKRAKGRTAWVQALRNSL